MTLLGIMQDKPLLISDIIRYAETYHPTREVVSRDARGREHRYSYGDAAPRARKLARVLKRWGIAPGHRVATLAMNHHRHFELFYGVSGLGAVLHTVNPRLYEDQIVYICNHAEDRALFFDSQFTPLVLALAPKLTTVERYVILDPEEDQNSESLASRLRGYTTFEAALASESDDFEWPSFDERTASSLCYTSGTTGNPKGVLYSHRSTVLHALTACQNSAMGLSCNDAIMPIAPMFHVNAWSTPYLAPMVGAKLVLPGPKLDAEILQALIEREAVTFTAAVPTVFVGLLEYLEDTGKRIDTLKKAVIGGSAVSPTMIDLLREKYGCFVAQMWGMTELSPLGTMTTLTPAVEALPAERRREFLHRQGRTQFGLELKILDDCTFTEVSSAADATVFTSALDWSAVADILCAVLCMELADFCKLSSAARTAVSNSTMRASMRVARSALAIRSLSCSVESARPSIMLSRKICSAFDIAAISSCWRER
jgi:3-(methylthio)propionyl---CoA ligase